MKCNRGGIAARSKSTSSPAAVVQTQAHDTRAQQLVTLASSITKKYFLRSTEVRERNLEHDVLERVSMCVADAHLGLNDGAGAHAAAPHLHAEQIVQQGCNKHEEIKIETKCVANDTNAPATRLWCTYRAPLKSASPPQIPKESEPAGGRQCRGIKIRKENMGRLRGVLV
jgi:hypothetical protein